MMCPPEEASEYTGIGLGVGLEASLLARTPGPQDPGGSSASSTGTDDLRARSHAALAGADDYLARARRFLDVPGPQDPGGSSASSTEMVSMSEGELHRSPPQRPRLCPAHYQAGQLAGPHEPGAKMSCGCCWGTCEKCRPELDPRRAEYNLDTQPSPPPADADLDSSEEDEDSSEDWSVVEEDMQPSPEPQGPGVPAD